MSTDVYPCLSPIDLIGRADENNGGKVLDAMDVVCRCFIASDEMPGLKQLC